MQDHLDLLRRRRMTASVFWATGLSVCTASLDEGRILHRIHGKKRPESAQETVGLEEPRDPGGLALTSLPRGYRDELPRRGRLLCLLTRRIHVAVEFTWEM